jgi:hypothetical protein
MMQLEEDGERATALAGATFVTSASAARTRTRIANLPIAAEKRAKGGPSLQKQARVLALCGLMQ